MEKLDLFKIFVNIPKIKPRKDTNTVMEEAVFILKKEYRLPPETVKAIESFESAQDQPFRVISYSNLLTKGEHAEKTVKIGNYEKKISMLLGEIFNQQLFQDVSVSKNIEKDAKELMAKQVVYSNLEGKPKGRVSYDIIILQLLQVSVKLWKKLGKSHCLTAISKDYGDVNSPLFYCLINGTPDDLENVSIFLKEVTLPCEGISIRELSSMQKNKAWFSIANSIVNHKSYSENSALIDSMIAGADARFKSFGLFLKEQNYYIISIAFDDEVMENIFPVYETYAQHIIPALVKGNSLYSCFVYFLISKAVSNESMKIDISSLNEPLKSFILTSVHSDFREL